MKLSQVINKLKTEKGIESIAWYFNTPAVKYGIANGIGGIWSITVSKAKCEVRARVGKPSHLSPTPQLAKGLAKALAVTL